MKSFKNQMCACKDAACAEKVKNDAKAWMEKNEDLKKKEPTEAQEERGEKIFDALRECEDKARGAEGEAKIAEAMTKMKGFADAMCACKDAACATKVSDEMMAWSPAMKDMDETKPTEAQSTELMEISARMSECMQKALAPADETGSAGSAAGSAN